jgi:hypothetical protein
MIERSVLIGRQVKFSFLGVKGDDEFPFPINKFNFLRPAGVVM